MAKTILLADDSITIQKIVNLTFSGEGIDVVTVSNGDAALKKIREIHPDLVLADIFMPGENGYELCEHIKNDPSLCLTPVILLIGAYEPFDQNEAARVKADGHLTKPFEIRVLISAVNSLIDAAQQAATSSAPVESVEPPAETLPESEVAMQWPVEEPSSELSFTSEEESFAASSMLADTAAGWREAAAVAEKIPSERKESAVSVPPPSDTAALSAILEEHPPSGRIAESIIPTIEASPQEPLMVDQVEAATAAEMKEPLTSPAKEENLPSAPLSTLQETSSFEEADLLGISGLESPPVLGEVAGTELAAEYGSTVIDIWETHPEGLLAPASVIPAQAKTDEVSALVMEEPAALPIRETIPAPLAVAVEPASPAEPVPAIAKEPPVAEEIPTVSKQLHIPPESLAAPSPVMISAPLDEEALADRITQKIMEKLSKEAIERIAWEVIPDLAELLIKEHVEAHLKQTMQT